MHGSKYGSVHKPGEEAFSLWIAFCVTYEHADAPHPIARLRAHRERPRSRRAADERDELTPLHVLSQAQEMAS
jgi:hypothetical protein